MLINLFGWRILSPKQDLLKAGTQEEIGKIVESLKPKMRSPVNLPEDITASDHFWDSFAHAGTIAVTCICGRLNFVDNDGADYEDGELEGYREQARKNPDRYVADHVNDYISVMELPAGTVAWGCPCNIAARHEFFIREWRPQILAYYKKLMNDVNYKAKRFHAQMEAVSEDSNR